MALNPNICPPREPSRLNHVNLCAGDVPGLADLFVRHFGFTVLQAGTVPEAAGTAAAGSAFAMLRDRHGFSLAQRVEGADRLRRQAGRAQLGVLGADVLGRVERHADVEAPGVDRAGVDGRDYASWTAFYCPVGDGLEIEINWCSRAIVDLVAVP